jgi:hypothetical protein
MPWLSLYEPHISPYGIIYPLHDLIKHDVFSEECVCGPTIKEVTTPKGNHLQLMYHHSLDGREKEEE